MRQDKGEKILRSWSKNVACFEYKAPYIMKHAEWAHISRKALVKGEDHESNQSTAQAIIISLT